MPASTVAKRSCFLSNLSERKGKQKCLSEEVCGPAASKNVQVKVVDLYGILASSSNFDILDFFQTEAHSGFKEKGFCNKEPPFPHFIKYRYELARYEDLHPPYYCEWIDHSCLKKCLYTGTGSNGLFWLPSVHELQALGYFSTVVHTNGFDESVLTTISNSLTSGNIAFSTHISGITLTTLAPLTRLNGQLVTRMHSGHAIGRI